MSDLLDKKCMPCEGGVLPFDVSEIHKEIIQFLARNGIGIVKINLPLKRQQQGMA